ncbi:MAG: hypothetical protein DRH51_03525, partial [Candidatus Coatesbacteria bacterium]
MYISFIDDCSLEENRYISIGGYWIRDDRLRNFINSFKEIKLENRIPDNEEIKYNPEKNSYIQRMNPEERK